MMSGCGCSICRKRRCRRLRISTSHAPGCCRNLLHAGRRCATLPFFLAVGDGAAANVGSGCVGGGQMALSLGTTAALRVVSSDPRPPVPRGMWSYRICAGLHLIGGATSEGGNIFEWTTQTLALPDDAERQLQARAPDVHGLTFLPLLAGERSPGWQASATGVIDGLRLSTTPLDILQAALEGVALRLAIIAEQALTGASPATRSSRSSPAEERWKPRPPWAQMFADALNRPLSLAGESEITARGTAIWR
ncbi:MAG: FGGY-family carbohydrate kinase [Anaerolineae bacterium]